jgi:hypothetical protein
MALFHFAAIPLFLLVLSGLYGSKSTDFKKLGFFFLQGAVAFIPAFLVYILFRSIIFPSYRPILLYLYGFFLDHCIYFIVVPIGFMIGYGLSNMQRVDFLEVSFFYSGFYALASVQTIILNWGVYDAYLLFYLPLLRIGIVLLASLFFVNIVYSYGWSRVGYIFGFIALPLAVACVTYFHETHRSFLSLLTTLAFVFVSLAIRYIVKE